MPAQRPFHVVDVNPNDVTGGGGCVCSPTKVGGCNGPYIVCPGNDMEYIGSPHVVIGAECARAFAAALDGETQAGGEVSPVQVVDSTAEELPTPVHAPRYEVVSDEEPVV